MRNRLMGLWLVFISLGASSAWAEPYLAAWKGVNCNACHLNQTGGWGRNDLGKNYGNSLETFDWQGLSDAAQVIKHNTPSFVSTGLDIHESYTATFNKNSALDQNIFDQTSPNYLTGASFSLSARVNEVVSGVFTYKLDQNEIKEVYGLISGLPEGLYFKLGRFTLPYGLELADDNSLVRSYLNGNFSFDGGTPDGMEVGIYPGPVFLNVALVNGDMSQQLDLSAAVTHTNSEKIVSAKGGINLSDFTLGGSVYGENLDLATKEVRGGAFGFGRLGPVVILGEFDSGYDGQTLIYDPLLPGFSDFGKNFYTTYHASAEVDLGRSIYLRATSEFIDHSIKKASVFDGFRHVLSLRSYPVRNFKFQIDLARMSATPNSPYAMAVGTPNYSLTADAFIFY